MASRRPDQGTLPRAWNVHEEHPDGNGQKLSNPSLLVGRDPPKLFLHPSPAASHVSLPGLFSPGVSSGHQSSTAYPSTPGPSSLGGLKPMITSLGQGPTAGRIPLRTADSARSADRTDALWAEMQATLEEVETSASGGTHVFGPEHDRKLAQLRAAQISLAQAWARSEADHAIETREGASTVGGATAGATGVGGVGDPKGAGHEATKSVDAPITDMKSIAAATNSVPRPGSSSDAADRLGDRLVEERKQDIIWARKRREDNDRYFQQVSMGVLDVVAKLEEVAAAMRQVEQESKDIWDEGEGGTANAKP